MQVLNSSFVPCAVSYITPITSFASSVERHHARAMASKSAHGFNASPYLKVRVRLS